MKTLCAVKIGNMKDSNEETRGRVQLLEMPEQEMGEEDVKIRVAYCSICGSDPHLVEGVFGWEPPFGLGHEVSGTIVALGSKAKKKGLKVGDRVSGNFLRFCGSCYYCLNGQEQFCEHANEYNRPGMAEYVVWHESQVWKIPDFVNLKEACLLEPVAIAVRIVDKANMKVGQRVAVSGGGPIGLLTLQLLKKFGATSLTLIEPIESRRMLAKQFGADYVIDPSSQNVREEADKITGGRGYDVIVEVSGARSAALTALDIAAKGGTVLYIAMFPKEYEMPLNLFDKCYYNELTITGTYVAPYAFARAIQLLPELDLKPFTQKVFPLDQGVEAFETHLSGKYPKVLIQCNEE